MSYQSTSTHRASQSRIRAAVCRCGTASSR